MEKRLVVFDLDGTLFQSHITSVQAMKAALRDCNLPVTNDNSLRAVIGGQMEEVCTRLAPDSDEVLRKFLGQRITVHEKELVKTQGKLFDGTEDMLRALGCDGYTLAICSNGKAEYIETVLSVCNIRRYFAAIRGRQLPMTKGQRLQELLADFAPSFAIMVGDRSHDFCAARENQISSIGVSFGYGAEEINLADHTARSPAAIVGIIKQLDASHGRE